MILLFVFKFFISLLFDRGAYVTTKASSTIHKRLSLVEGGMEILFVMRFSMVGTILNQLQVQRKAQTNNL